MAAPFTASVLLHCSNGEIANTLRIAMKGVGLRKVFTAATPPQVVEGLTVAEPDVVLLYVDGPDESDEGLSVLRSVRRSSKQSIRKIPVVAVSPRRDMATINAVMDAGAHEYVLFPASGEMLLRRIVTACTARRAFIDTPDYVGPERKTMPTRGSGPDGERRGE